MSEMIEMIEMNEVNEMDERKDISEMCEIEEMDHMDEMNEMIAMIEMNEFREVQALNTDILTSRFNAVYTDECTAPIYVCMQVSQMKTRAKRMVTEFEIEIDFSVQKV